MTSAYLHLQIILNNILFVLPPTLRIFIPSLEPPTAFIISAYDKPYCIEDDGDQCGIEPEITAFGDQSGAAKSYDNSCTEYVKTDHPRHMTNFFCFFEIIDHLRDNVIRKQDIACEDQERIQSLLRRHRGELFAGRDLC